MEMIGTFGVTGMETVLGRVYLERLMFLFQARSRQKWY